MFDSHCHLTDERLAAEAPAGRAGARAAGVTRIVTVGTDPEDAAAAVALAARLDGVWAAVGIHPHGADGADADARARILDLARADEAVALGETGLDYHYENAPRAAQRRAFEWHVLKQAAALGLPVIVHSRAADADTAAVLRDAGRDVAGVLHCFAGGPELLEAGLEVGWYFSFSGLVTFRNYDGAALVRRVPSDRLLAETDSPYLAPVPRRGRRNEPAFVRHVIEGIAAHRGEPLDDVARATARNACRLYGLEAARDGGDAAA